jgi:peptidoglycan hydrolase CwlO-like protein
MEKHKSHSRSRPDRDTVRLFKMIHRLSLQLFIIMSAISEFASKVSAFFDRQDVAISDLQGDVDNLTAQIAALQASAGFITPEDQALLDGIQARAQVLSDKLDALDALTPPATPVAPT